MQCTKPQVLLGQTQVSKEEFSSVLLLTGVAIAEVVPGNSYWDSVAVSQHIVAPCLSIHFHTGIYWESSTTRTNSRGCTQRGESVLLLRGGAAATRREVGSSGKLTVRMSQRNWVRSGESVISLHYSDDMSEFWEHSERGVDEYSYTADWRKDVSTLPTPRAHTWGVRSGLRRQLAQAPEGHKTGEQIAVLHSACQPKQRHLTRSF